MDGNLEQAGDLWQLRFTRELAHPPEKVWRAITQPRHLEAWFPPRIVGGWTVGAPLEFQARGGEHPAFDGEVLACGPPSLPEVRWGPHRDPLPLHPPAPGAPSVL